MFLFINHLRNVKSLLNSSLAVQTNRGQIKQEVDEAKLAAAFD